MANIGDIIGGIIGGANPLKAPSDAINAAKGFLGLFKTDPTVKAQIEAQLTEDNLDFEKTSMAGQLAVNLQEAKNNRIFDDWRDAVGWTCAIALLWNYVLQPFIVFGLIVFHIMVDQSILPKLDMVSLMTLLGSMLGTGVSQFHAQNNS